MNKVAINTLCILILAVLGASVLLPGIGMGYYFTKGIEEGYNKSELQTPKDEGGFFVDAVPVSLVNTPDELRDTLRFDNGKEYEVEYSGIRIKYGPERELDEVSSWTVGISIVLILSVILIVFFFILLAIKFVKFVIHINNGEIFSKRNIKLLSWIGIFLILIAVLQITIGITDDIVLSRMNLRLEGLQFTASWSIPWSNLLMGLLSLLMSQIWRRGLYLKQEQELTI